MTSLHKPGKLSKSEKPRETNVQVAVRCRPISELERKQHSHSVVTVSEQKKEISVGVDLAGKSSKKTFCFDKVFGPDAKQIDVYKSVVVPTIDEVLQGYNCTIFAYGQTGTGKTFTMEGERTQDLQVEWDEDPLAGIIPRALHQLFQTLQGMEVEFSVRVSFLEIYQEELFDLLGGNDARLRMYEDAAKKGSVVISGLEERPVHDKNEVFQILEAGWKKRQTAATKMNDQSSRSHAVFTILVHIKETAVDGEEMVKCGKLYLVDLAGSENIGRSGAVDRRAKEAGNINQSLLTLGRVIKSLVEHAPHIPYRESKLTRLLQDSLGGSTKTSIIATVSPAHCNIEESLSTLDYAHRARNITNRPEVNQRMTKRALIKQYTEEIERLRQDLHAAREKDGFFVSRETYMGMEGKINTQDHEMEDLHNRITGMEEEIKKINDLFHDTKETLEHTTEKLATTQLDLEDTSAKLQQTKQNLKETVIERDQQTHLVGEHVTVETELYSQATELLTTTESSLGDLDGVHSKLDRKKAVEKHNMTQQEKFKQTISTNLGKMKKNISQNCKKQIEHFAKEQESCDIFFTEQCSAMESVVGQMKLLSSGVKNQTNQLIGSEPNNQNGNHSMHGLLTFVTDSMNLLGKTLNDMTCTMKQRQTQSRQQLSQHIEETQQFEQQCLSQLQELMTEQCKATEYLQSIIHKSQQGETHQHVQRNQFHSSLLQQIEALKVMVDEQQTISQTGHEQLKSEMVEAKECVQSMQTNTKQYVDVIQSTVGNYSSEHVNSLKATSQELDEGFEQEIKTTDNVSTQCVEMAEKTKNSIHMQIKSLETLHCDVDTQTQEQVAAATVMNEKNEAKRNETVTSMSYQSSGTKLWSDFMEGQIQNRVTECQAFIDEELKEDVPTGTTPVRRQFNYPRDLQKTAPHEILINKFMEVYQPKFDDEEEIPEEQEENTQPTVQAPDKIVTADSTVSEKEVSDIENEISDTESVDSNRGIVNRQTRKVRDSKLPTPNRSRLPLRAPNAVTGNVMDDTTNSIQRKALAKIPGMTKSDPEAGNMPDVTAAGSMHEFLKILHSKYGPVATFWFGNRQYVSLGSPEALEDDITAYDRPRKSRLFM
ncbi:kinesin-like protein KIF11 [Glandiceps talaboti]